MVATRSEPLPANAYGTDRVTPLVLRADQEVLEELAGESGLPVFLWTLGSDRLLMDNHHPRWLGLPPSVQAEFRSVKTVQIVSYGESIHYYGIPVLLDGTRPVVLGGFARSCHSCHAPEFLALAQEAGWSRQQFDDWLETIPVLRTGLLRHLARLQEERFRSRTAENRLTREVNALSLQIDYTFEEISLLHSLTQKLQLSQSPDELARYCLSRLGSLVPADANAIWMESAGEDQQFFVEGDLHLDEFQLAQLISHFDGHDWSRPLVKNQLPRTELGADFPGLRNLIVVPIGEAPHRRGWMISTNLSNGRDFGSVEASLLGSIATIIGTHLRNLELYREHHELLISFVRSLVHTLDAKDPYTRGHSERVALIGRRLGEEMGLPRDELENIYLSGLLHDLGKIGIDDRILRKTDKLTAEEFQEIQEHPMIGYRILRQMKNLQQVLPGVRSHHENFNGTGYPDKLRGAEIPLMARILSVADSYDAMKSDRPYRSGLPLERVESIFRDDGGKQWDPAVVAAYFRCREDIQQLCQSYSPSDDNLLSAWSAVVPNATAPRQPYRF